MKNERIEEIIILLNEARNKITKANIIYGNTNVKPLTKIPVKSELSGRYELISTIELI